MTINELKDLIIFAGKNRVKSIELSGVKFEMSELAHIDGITEQDMGTGRNTAVAASITSLVEDGALSDEEEEDLLFHSSRP